MSEISLHRGMEVFGNDNARVGRVREVRGLDFLVDRMGEMDIYVPLGSVASVDGERVTINVSALDVDSQGWPSD